MSNPQSIEARLDRLESLEQIRQLPARYGLALDMRDLDALAGLFVADVRVGRDRSGRRALRDWLDETLRVQFTGTSHHIGNHIIEFADADHARGVVYSKNEHETSTEWVIMQMMYVDDYERRDGRWFFKRRLPLYWYATDLNKPPLGMTKMRWPGVEPYEGLDVTFRVGVGSTTFRTQYDGPTTITCGASSPCQIVLKLQYPKGFGFKGIHVTYR